LRRRVTGVLPSRLPDTVGHRRAKRPTAEVDPLLFLPPKTQ
jgi:hypothetical protein